ncbi:MAG: PIN domain-containing protein [Acidobacteriota bacterium]
MIVLDPDLVVLYFRGHPAVARRLLATPPSELAIPSVAIHEVLVAIGEGPGAARRRGELDRLLESVRTPWFGLAEARVAARLRHAAIELPAFDLMLASTALCYDAAVATPRPEAFAQVADLRTIDWSADDSAPS